MQWAVASLSQSLLSRSNRSLLQLALNSAASVLDRRGNSRTTMEVVWITRPEVVRVQSGYSNYSTMAQAQMHNQYCPRVMTTSKVQYENQAMHQHSERDAGGVRKHQIGENVSKKDKINFLFSTRGGELILNSLSRAFLQLVPVRLFGTGQAAHIHEEKKRGGSLSVGQRRPQVEATEALVIQLTPCCQSVLAVMLAKAGLLDLKDSKEAVYGALDAWVAWEQNFPIASLKRVLIALEKEQQWHKVVQVIKWMISKGQGTTMGTYRQLIQALDMDHRAEEAHKFWVKKIGNDLHSVPWQLCKLMISIYYRNNMLERLVKVSSSFSLCQSAAPTALLSWANLYTYYYPIWIMKLFKGLEAFDRKPPEKSVVKKVADAFELLGLLEEQKRVLEKYNSLFTETWKGCPKKSRMASQKKPKKSGMFFAVMIYSFF
ncbi:hypothetical protein HHK36_013238 [Tetracentron sinense]|uniref:Pentatricopeptide repeat-containing protein n=1 Tax=Tetracentron sinense TaxID=13715 RepID=A0A835DGE1_TETSI|nr:hypothetical protein HHK36_013238 [Tetracentron sinense]